jgi:DNA repair photolyase
LDVKVNALQLLEKYRKKPLLDRSIYMSSVTDPYQPVEKELKLTRNLLQELLDYHQPRLVIQTRSPLVTRDIDLLKRFKNIQVNMTVTTDNEGVRKIFEPLCPSNVLRLEAVKKINNEGIPTCITLTPLLPVTEPISFAEMLVATGVKKFIIQPFHSEKGRFVGATREEAARLIKDMEWTMDKYQKVYDTLNKYIPDLGVGQDGFKPI